MIARGSVTRYQGSSRPFAEIARELNVDALVTGSVTRIGGLVSVAVQLVDPLTESQLWANRYERDRKDVIRLQNDIVSAIVGELRLQLTPGDTDPPGLGERGEPGRLRRVLERPHRGQPALTAEPRSGDGVPPAGSPGGPGFALAHAGIARVWSIRGHLGYVLPRDAVPEVQAAVSRRSRWMANSRRPTDCWPARASISNGTGRPPSSRGNVAPNSIRTTPNCWVGRAAFSAAMGQTEGTATPFERALESDPYNPQLRDFYGHQLVRLRRYDEAIVQFQQVSERGDPSSDLR